MSKDERELSLQGTLSVLLRHVTFVLRLMGDKERIYGRQDAKVWVGRRVRLRNDLRLKLNCNFEVRTRDSAFTQRGAREISLLRSKVLLIVKCKSVCSNMRKIVEYDRSISYSWRLSILLYVHITLRKYKVTLVIFGIHGWCKLRV